MRPRRGPLGSSDPRRIGGTLLGAEPELPEGLRVFIRNSSDNLFKLMYLSCRNSKAQLKIEMRFRTNKLLGHEIQDTLSPYFAMTYCVGDVKVTSVSSEHMYVLK